MRLSLLIAAASSLVAHVAARPRPRLSLFPPPGDYDSLGRDLNEFRAPASTRRPIPRPPITIFSPIPLSTTAPSSPICIDPIDGGPTSCCQDLSGRRIPCPTTCNDPPCCFDSTNKQVPCPSQQPPSTTTPPPTAETCIDPIDGGHVSCCHDVLGGRIPCPGVCNEPPCCFDSNKKQVPCPWTQPRTPTSSATLPTPTCFDPIDGGPTSCCHDVSGSRIPCPGVCNAPPCCFDSNRKQVPCPFKRDLQARQASSAAPPPPPPSSTVPEPPSETCVDPIDGGTVSCCHDLGGRRIPCPSVCNSPPCCFNSDNTQVPCPGDPPPSSTAPEPPSETCVDPIDGGTVSCCHDLEGRRIPCPSVCNSPPCCFNSDNTQVSCPGDPPPSSTAPEPPSETCVDPIDGGTVSCCHDLEGGRIPCPSACNSPPCCFNSDHVQEPCPWLDPPPSSTAPEPPSETCVDPIDGGTVSCCHDTRGGRIPCPHACNSPPCCFNVDNTEVRCPWVSDTPSSSTQPPPSPTEPPPPSETCVDPIDGGTVSCCHNMGGGRITCPRECNSPPCCFDDGEQFPCPWLSSDLPPSSTAPPTCETEVPIITRDGRRILVKRQDPNCVSSSVEPPTFPSNSSTIATPTSSAPPECTTDVEIITRDGRRIIVKRQDPNCISSSAPIPSSSEPPLVCPSDLPSDPPTDILFRRQVDPRCFSSSIIPSSSTQPPPSSSEPPLVCPSDIPSDPEDIIIFRRQVDPRCFSSSVIPSSSTQPPPSSSDPPLICPSDIPEGGDDRIIRRQVDPRCFSSSIVPSSTPSSELPSSTPEVPSSIPELPSSTPELPSSTVPPVVPSQPPEQPSQPPEQPSQVPEDPPPQDPPESSPVVQGSPEVPQDPLPSLEPPQTTPALFLPSPTPNPEPTETQTQAPPPPPQPITRTTNTPTRTNTAAQPSDPPASDTSLPTQQAATTDGGGSGSFWDNKPAVAGTFAGVAVASLLLLFFVTKWVMNKNGANNTGFAPDQENGMSNAGGSQPVSTGGAAGAAGVIVFGGAMGFGGATGLGGGGGTGTGHGPQQPVGQDPFDPFSDMGGNGMHPYAGGNATGYGGAQDVSGTQYYDPFQGNQVGFDGTTGISGDGGATGVGMDGGANGIANNVPSTGVGADAGSGIGNTFGNDIGSGGATGLGNGGGGVTGIGTDGGITGIGTNGGATGVSGSGAGTGLGGFGGGGGMTGGVSGVPTGPAVVPQVGGVGHVLGGLPPPIIPILPLRYESDSDESQDDEEARNAIRVTRARRFSNGSAIDESRLLS